MKLAPIQMDSRRRQIHGARRCAIDGINNRTTHTFWQTAGAFPQSVTLDLGRTYPDVGMLAYLPQYSLVMGGGALIDGAVSSYRILTSVDGIAFTEAASGSWSPDGTMKTVSFAPVVARYARLEARAAMGPSAVASDITVGANR